MQLDISSKAGRRQIADEFKERKVARGIYAVRCAGTGGAWVNWSPNLDAARNSLWFQLNAGRYRNAALQQAWKQHGETAFAIEVLERFSDEISPLLLDELYIRKKKDWVEILSAQSL